jgi:hypothetical protein
MCVCVCVCVWVYVCVREINVSAVVCFSFSNLTRSPVRTDVYHVTFNPPPKGQEANVTKLDKDSEPATAQALQDYQRDIDGILSCFPKILRRFNADQPLVRCVCVCVCIFSLSLSLCLSLSLSCSLCSLTLALQENVAAQVWAYINEKPASNAPFLPRIALLGPTGSGRTTQAKLLANRYNLVYGERAVCAVACLSLSVLVFLSLLSSLPRFSLFSRLSLSPLSSLLFSSLLFSSLLFSSFLFSSLFSLLFSSLLFSTLLYSTLLYSLMLTTFAVSVDSLVRRLLASKTAESEQFKAFFAKIPVRSLTFPLQLSPKN